MKVVTLVFEKSTKNMHRFNATSGAVGSLYFPKESMPTPPKTLEVQVKETA